MKQIDSMVKIIRIKSGIIHVPNIQKTFRKMVENVLFLIALKILLLHPNESISNSRILHFRM